MLRFRTRNRKQYVAIVSSYDQHRATASDRGECSRWPHITGRTYVTDEQETNQPVVRLQSLLSITRRFSQLLIFVTASVQREETLGRRE